MGSQTLVVTQSTIHHHHHHHQNYNHNYTDRGPGIDITAMKHFSGPLLLLLCVVSVQARRSRAISGQERGGVGIQLPSIPLWPWSSSQERKARPVSSLNIGQRRQETGDPRYNKLTFTKKQPTKAVFTKKPTGLEKKPFGPKYPAKFSKYQNYKKSPKLSVKKVRLAPIPDLRPTSIDRIDILRPQNLPKPPPKLVGKKPSVFKVAPQTQRRQPGKPGKPVIQTVRTKTRVGPSSGPSKPAQSKVVNFKQKPIEVDGLKIFMFRGDEGIGGFKPLLPPPISDSLFDPNSRPVESLYKPFQLAAQSPPLVRTPIRWSQAEISPSTPRSFQKDVPPPFPTRHTTPSPHQSDQPVVIIAQSNVAQN